MNTLEWYKEKVEQLEHELQAAYDRIAELNEDVEAGLRNPGEDDCE